MKHILSILQDFGLNLDTLFTKLNLNREVLEDVTARFDGDICNAIFLYSEQKLHDPIIGLRVGAKFRLSTYLEAGNILAFCRDLEHAFEVNARYGPLMETIGSPHMVKDKDPDNITSKIIWTPNSYEIQDQSFRHLTDFFVATYVMTVNWLAWGFGRGIETATFGHQNESDIIAYSDVLGCKVIFGASENAAILKKGILNLPLPTAHANKFELLNAKQAQVLASFQGRSNLVFRVEEVIRQTILVAKPSVDNVADTLGLSGRSMRRYLRDRGTTYQEILDQVKKDICKNLSNDGLSLAEIAQALWYNDQSAFTRAYKKWHGMSPKQHFNSLDYSANHSATLGAK